MTGMVIISIICIVCAFLLWNIADKRGVNRKIWAIMGAVLAFIFLTKTKDSKAIRPDR